MIWYNGPTNKVRKMDKKIKDWSFEELADEVTRQMHSALLEGGGKAMKSRFYIVFNIIEQWRKEARGELEKNGAFPPKSRLEID